MSVLASRAALFAAITLALGLCFEVGMRWYGGSEAAPVFQQLFMQDARIGHRPRPNARAHYVTSEFATDIAINAAGVRGPEIAPPRPDERRIVVLGDSLVLSVQVEIEQTFGQLLEARLNARHDGTTYRVINAGVQGYGPVEEWLFFDHVVADLRPDVVLVAVFVANDAIEALDSARKLEAGVPLAEEVREEALNWARRLVRRSMVLQTVRLRYDAVRERLRGGGAAPQRPLMTYLADPPPEVQRGLDIAVETFGRIEQRASQIGARTAFVLVPARFQLDDGDHRRLGIAVSAAGGVLDRHAATRRFAGALSALEAPVLDLLPLLQREADPVGLFFTRNIHFTPRGHEVVAGALDRFLTETGLLDHAGRTERAHAPHLP
jgi:hypothetical protein